MQYFFIGESDLTLMLQLVIATVLGMALGLERSLIGKTAGMRTYGLVSLGSCLLVATSLLVAGKYLGLSTFDPLRMAAAIVMGIGFLGGGLILVHNGHSQGLTTAAGLWIAMAIGIVVGFKLYAVAIFTTLVTLIIFTLMWRVESRFKEIKQSISDNGS